MTFEWKREWLPVLALAGALGATLYLYGRLPDPMPIHWNASGQPDDFTARPIGAFLMPGLTLLLYGFFLLIPRIDPRRENIQRFWETFRFFRSTLVVFLSYFQLVVLKAALSSDQRIDTSLLVGGIGVFLIVIGNVMPRVRSNWFLGIRTPWTLENEQVWRRTHRVAGRVTVVGGLLVLLTSLLSPAWQFAAVIAAAVAIGLIGLVYSFIEYRRQMQDQNADASQGV